MHLRNCAERQNHNFRVDSQRDNFEYSSQCHETKYTKPKLSGPDSAFAGTQSSPQRDTDDSPFTRLRSAARNISSPGTSRSILHQPFTLLAALPPCNAILSRCLTKSMYAATSKQFGLHTSVNTPTLYLVMSCSCGGSRIIGAGRLPLLPKSALFVFPSILVKCRCARSQVTGSVGSNSRNLPLLMAKRRRWMLIHPSPPDL
jgi:hypothetical protein